MPSTLRSNTDIYNVKCKHLKGKAQGGKSTMKRIHTVDPCRSACMQQASPALHTLCWGQGGFSRMRMRASCGKWYAIWKTVSQLPFCSIQFSGSLDAVCFIKKYYPWLIDNQGGHAWKCTRLRGCLGHSPWSPRRKPAREAWVHLDS